MVGELLDSWKGSQRLALESCFIYSVGILEGCHLRIRPLPPQLQAHLG